MKFLKHLLDSKLSALTLLDMAYVVVLLPLLISFKAPMLVFIFTVLLILGIKKTPANNYWVFFVFLFGVVTIYLSMYGAFSFRGLSRLKLFIELLTYVLLVVVSMQRLTHKINFYLLISPFLFLALSLFFYHGILMLAYVIFEIFFLLWMILAHRMGGDMLESFRSSMVMFMYSLPWVVILFIFFPRISFEHANYGFRGEDVQRMGHDGTMFLDNNALLVPSERIVMEVGFNKNVPSSNNLYFRGSILYIDKKDHWEPIPDHVQRETKPYYETKGEQVEYKVTLYPTQKHWIYLLDMPQRAVKDSILDRDLISTLENDIEETIHYSARSSMSFKFHDILDTYTRDISLSYVEGHNPQTYLAAQKIKNLYISHEKRAQSIVQFFKDQSLTYSLKPEPLNINHTSDSFLFDKRKGYCVHFASSFVTMARMAGIPARIVTGYKADATSAMRNYLAVKERDAHAWAELYINNHWIRYESTATASHIEEQVSQKEKNELFESINLYLMYAKYQVETWILYYSHIRQLQLLAYAKNNPTFVFIFVLSLILLVILTFVIISYFKRPTYSSETIEILQPLLRKMRKEGFLRDKDETLHHYFTRYMKGNSPQNNITEIDKLYEKITYGGDTSKASKNQLKKLIRQLQ